MADYKMIPIIQPTQFDDFLFSEWQSPTTFLYQKFHLERIENYKSHLKLPRPPHRRSVYYFIYLTKGKVIRSKGLNQYEILLNTLFCVAANEISSLDFVSEDAEGFYCHFHPEIFNHTLLKVNIQQDFEIFNASFEPIIEIKNNERISQLLEILYYDFQHGQISTLPIYFLALLSEFNQNWFSKKKFVKDTATLMTTRYKVALVQFISEKKNVSDYAAYLSVTPNHLHKCVKNSTGKTAHELLDEMRLLEAQVLLKQTDLSIGEIAFKVGKEDPSDFSRFFKSKTNLTPNQYRKEQ